MGYISTFTVDRQLLMRLIEDRSQTEIGVEYKLIFRNGLYGGKLDGGSRGWKKATFKQLELQDLQLTDTYTLTLLPQQYILEGTCMEWKIRIEGQKRRWIPQKSPSSWTAIHNWFYKRPPLKKLTGKFVVQPTQVSIFIV